MENGKLKVGQSCEVVKVLTQGGYSQNWFNIDSYTVTKPVRVHLLENDLIDVLDNSGDFLTMRRNTEVKTVFKLTITKVK